MHFKDITRDTHFINDPCYLNTLQKVADEMEKNVYAIHNDGAMIYDRKTGDLKIFGNVNTFLPKESK